MPGPELRPPQPKRRLKPAERRSQIVDAAVAFFAEVGLEGRTRDLSARLGIGQSLLYKYFESKEALIEAVFERVYLDRLRPEWRDWLCDRTVPLRTRMLRFYTAYTEAIFTYEWMRIFMFSGLAKAKLNARYLAHLHAAFLEPMRLEIAAASDTHAAVEMEDIWNLHGGIVYIGIRRFVYQTPTPPDVGPAIERAIDRFLSDVVSVTDPCHPR